VAEKSVTQIAIPCIKGKKLCTPAQNVQERLGTSIQFGKEITLNFKFCAVKLVITLV